VIGSVGGFILSNNLLEGCSGSEPDNKEGRLACRGVFFTIRGVDDPFLDFDFVIIVCYRTFDAFIHSGLPNSSR